MRINWMILLQTIVSAAAGLGIVCLQRHAGGPGDGMFLGILGSLIAWLIIPPISHDIGRVRRWLASSSAVNPRPLRD
jgi:hypothetical protein